MWTQLCHVREDQDALRHHPPAAHEGRRVRFVREICETFYARTAVRCAPSARCRTLRSSGRPPRTSSAGQASRALRAIDLAITASMDLRVTLDVSWSTSSPNARGRRFDPGGAPFLQLLEFAGCKDSEPPRSGRLVSASAMVRRRVALSRSCSPSPTSPARRPPGTSLLHAAGGLRAYFGAPADRQGTRDRVIEVYQRRPFEPDREWLGFFEALRPDRHRDRQQSALHRAQRSADDLVMPTTAR